MANTDKNILITPSRGLTTDPSIVFSGADASTAPQNITLRVYPTSNGTLSFEGSAGQLLSVTNDLTGTIFSVNDVSGIPSIEVNASGLIKIAQYSGNTLFGTGIDNGTDKVQVSGTLAASILKSTIATGTAPLTVASTTLVSNLNANLLGGLSVHAGTNNEVNKVVRTDANGYIQAGWINTISGDNGATAIDRVYASNDGYIRYYSPTNFRTVLNVPTRTGGDASGTWNIAISGNAATATSANSATFLNSSNYINRTGSSGNLNTDFTNTPAGSMRHSGDDANIANSPGATWWFYNHYRHSNGSNAWGVQIAWGWEDNANRLATRNVSGGSFGGWVYYLNSANVGTYAVPAGGTAGNASSISSALGNSHTWTGLNYFRSNRNTTGTDSPMLQAYSDNGGGAIMAFHRGGAFAINFGLDSDNVIRFGGWSAAANRFQMDMSGNLTMAGNVTAFSDENLKKDWADLAPNFVEQLAKVKNGTYARIDEEGLRQVGVGARSLEVVMPEAVLTDNSDVKSVAYGNAALAAAVELAKAVVELRQQVAELQAEIKNLKR